MPRAVTKVCAWLGALMAATCIAQAAEVVFDAASIVGDPIPDALFGHNLQWRTHRDQYIWDTDSREIKPSALSVLRSAAGVDGGTGKAALVRFPGGSLAETYHWRRAVGVSRPKTDNPDKNCDSWEFTNNFGTDELMEFIHQMYADNPEAGAIITVNWWGFNDPVQVPPGMTLGQRAAQGMQEAANWVEYCNGVVDSTLIQQADTAGWVSCEWVDPITYEESFAQNAIEYADGVHSWTSDAPDAPDGYFAWLRRYFAWQRAGSPSCAHYTESWRCLEHFQESDYGAPYNIKYWEIGNEDWKYLSASNAGKYRGNADPEDPDNDERGVIDYSVAMKAKDPTIKIGAAMNDTANLREWDNDEWVPTATPGLSTWDTTVLDSISAPHIDFLGFHPYVGGSDDRCRLYLYGEKSASETACLLPYELQQNVDYDFRIRARGTPGEGLPTDDVKSYPIMAVWLVPYDSQTGYNESAKIRLKLVDGPQVLYTEVPSGDCITTGIVDDPANISAAWTCVDRVTPSSAKTGYNTDYKFTTVGVTKPSGTYGIWIRMMNNKNAAGCPPNGRVIDVHLITCFDCSLTYSLQNERLVYLAAQSEHNDAIFAAPLILEKRIQALKELADTHGTEEHQIELAATEFANLWSTTVFNNEPDQLKSALVVADMLRVMMEQAVSVANYWMLNEAYTNIAQPFNNPYTPVTGCCWNAQATPYGPECAWGRDDQRVCDQDGRWWAIDHDPDNYLKSSVACVYELLAKYFLGRHGMEMSSSDLPTFDNVEYDAVAALTGTPLLSMLGAVGDSTDTWGTGEFLNKYYILVINKDAEENQQCDVTIQRLHGKPTSVVARVLKCKDSGFSGQEMLDLQNSSVYSHSDVITLYENDSSTITSTPTYDSGDNEYTIPCSFYKGSVTVLEITLGTPDSTMDMPIADAIRNAPLKGAVQLKGDCVTAKFDDDERLYVQDPGVPTGIAVEWDGTAPTGVASGSLVTVQGISQVIDGEKVVAHGVVSHTGTGDGILSLGMPNKWLGGKSPDSTVPALKDGLGLYNVGTLVNTWGKVTYVDNVYPYTFFYINDGSHQNDGSGHTGIRVIKPSDVTMPELNDYLWIVGISGAEIVGDNPVRVLRMRGGHYQSYEWGEVPVWTDQNPYGWKVKGAEGILAYSFVAIQDGWNFLAQSTVPYPANPEEIVQAASGNPIDIQGNLYRCDWDTDTWIAYDYCYSGVFGNCSLGDVLMLNRGSDGAATITYTGASPEWNGNYDWDQWVSLPNEGQLFIANPFPETVSWSTVSITDGAQVMSLSGASQAGWISGALPSGDWESHEAEDITTERAGLAFIVPDPN